VPTPDEGSSARRSLVREPQDVGSGAFVLSPAPVWAVLAVILALGLLLRVNQYTAAPKLRENVDELAWTWAGLSLIEEHSPTSWSYLPAYPETFPLREPDTGRVLPGVHHWLDHPPVFALLVGGTAWLAGERQFEDVTAGVIRLPVIALSMLTLLLAFLLGRRLLGPLPALLGAALFAVAPGAVLGSRQVESEALLAPLLLLSLLLLHRLLREEARGFEWPLLLFLCFLAPTVKVPGAAFGVIVAVVLVAHRRGVEAAMAAGAGVLGLAAYATYGLGVDAERFLAVVQAQAARHSGLLSGFEFIASPAGFGDSVQLHDGWWLLGWLGLALAATLRGPRRADLFLAWPVAAYALAMMLLADPANASRYGWYRFAIYPLVYLSAAAFAARTVRQPSLVPVALLAAVPAAAATLGSNPFGGRWNPPVVLDLAALTVLVAASLAAGRMRGGDEGWRRWWPQAAVGVLVAVLLVLNLVQSLRLAEVYSSL
jgi:4-amino-4-deoxy-L-arabinose transferase-like glycosyltransferase